MTIIAEKRKGKEVSKGLPVFFYALLATALVHLLLIVSFREKTNDVTKDASSPRFSVITREGRLDLKEFAFSLKYHDPEAFLKSGNSPFGSSSLPSDAASSPAPALPDKPEKVMLDAPAKKLPVSVPDGYEAARPLDVSLYPAERKEAKAMKYPVCTDVKGNVIDVVSDYEKVGQDVINSVRKATVLQVNDDPIGDFSVPPETRIISSCGNAKLDAVARRTIDRTVLSGKAVRGTVRIYWNAGILSSQYADGENGSAVEVKK